MRAREDREVGRARARRLDRGRDLGRPPPRPRRCRSRTSDARRAVGARRRGPPAGDRRLSSRSALRAAPGRCSGSAGARGRGCAGPSGSCASGARSAPPGTRRGTAEQVLDLGAAEAVDALVVVAHHGEVAARRRRAASPARTARGSCPGTRPRGCSGSGPATSRRRYGALAQQPQREPDLRAEVDAAVREQQLLDTRRRPPPSPARRPRGRARSSVVAARRERSANAR